MPRLPFTAGKNLNKAFNARGAGSTSGRVVGKDELLSRVWPGTFVHKSSLSQNIYLLRRALGGDHYIETVPKIAYRFTVPVDPEAFEPDQKISPDPPSPAPNQVTNRWNSRLWLVALIPLLASGFLLWRHRSYPSPTAQIRSIAVLPFVSLGEQANQTALADGLTEQLIYEPTRSSGLHVVARTSSSQFRNQTQDVRETGRSLNVDAILEGSVRRDGDTLRVTGQLDRTSDGYHLWARTFDRPLRDTLGLQEEIAQSLAESVLGAPVTGGSHTRFLPHSAEAREAYLDGRFQWNIEAGPGMLAAPDLFRKAWHLSRISPRHTRC